MSTKSNINLIDKYADYRVKLEFYGKRVFVSGSGFKKPSCNAKWQKIREHANKIKELLESTCSKEEED